MVLWFVNTDDSRVRSFLKNKTKNGVTHLDDQTDGLVMCNLETTQYLTTTSRTQQYSSYSIDKTNEYEWCKNMHNSSKIVSDALQWLPAHGEKSKLHKSDKTAAESFCMSDGNHLFAFGNYAEYARYSDFSHNTVSALSPVLEPTQQNIKDVPAITSAFSSFSVLCLFHVKHIGLPLCINHSV